MSGPMLKLKQASAVLQVQPKELQNLVQFGVVKPKRSEGTYYFDRRALLAAKVALYLKESLGTRTSVLSKLIGALSELDEKLKAENPNYVVFNCRLVGNQEPLKLGVPLRALGEQIEGRVRRVDLYPDLPRGKSAEAEKRISEIASRSGGEHRRGVRGRNLAYGEELSPRAACLGDHRCRRKLDAASSAWSLTQAYWLPASQVAESLLFEDGIPARISSTYGQRKIISFGLLRKTFSMSTRKF